MKARITQPHIYGTPVVTDGRALPPTQGDRVAVAVTQAGWLAGGDRP